MCYTPNIIAAGLVLNEHLMGLQWPHRSHYFISTEYGNIGIISSANHSQKLGAGQLILGGLCPRFILEAAMYSGL